MLKVLEGEEKWGRQLGERLFRVEEMSLRGEYRHL